MYACQLWNNFLSSSLKRIRAAYNNSFRFLHGLARYVSARKHQVLNNITTFNAVLRKMSCSFVYRCYESINKLISSLMASECFINSSYYKHDNALLYLQEILGNLFFKVLFFLAVSYSV